MGIVLKAGVRSQDQLYKDRLCLGLIVDTFFDFLSRVSVHMLYQRFKLKLATPYMTAKGEQHQAHPAEEAAKVTSEENLSWSSDRERLNFHQMPKTETF